MSRTVHCSPSSPALVMVSVLVEHIAMICCCTLLIKRWSVRSWTICENCYLTLLHSAWGRLNLGKETRWGEAEKLVWQKACVARSHVHVQCVRVGRPAGHTIFGSLTSTLLLSTWTGAERWYWTLTMYCINSQNERNSLGYCAASIIHLCMHTQRHYVHCLYSKLDLTLNK